MEEARQQLIGAFFTLYTRKTDLLTWCSPFILPVETAHEHRTREGVEGDHVILANAIDREILSLQAPGVRATRACSFITPMSFGRHSSSR